MKKKVCLMCGERAYRLPLDVTSSNEGDWKCYECEFRWKKHGKSLFYVGFDDAYVTWLPVPEGCLLVFDKETRSSAWHRSIL